MKSIINTGNEKKELPFPKLMVSNNGNVVLFVNSQEGFCVYSSPEFDRLFGLYDTWNISDFTDFNGSITLSNE